LNPIDKLIGEKCDEEYAGSLGVLIKVIKDHKRLLCTLNKNCEEDCGRLRDNNSGTKCCKSLCSCCDDPDCCPSCRVTLVELLEDFRRVNYSRHLLFAFQKDLACLLETIMNFYGNRECRQPCLPKCDELFRNIMYLVKLCLKTDCHCNSNDKAPVCKGCKPEPALYPIVAIIFLALYFGNQLQKYVELYCCCCSDKDINSPCEEQKMRAVSVCFKDRDFDASPSHVSNGDLVALTVRCIKISDQCNELFGTTDVIVTGVYHNTENERSVTGTFTSVVNDNNKCVGQLFGSAVVTLGHDAAKGLLSGMLLELKKKDPCTTYRNPYNDAQPGMQVIFSLLDKINQEKMFEVVGDGLGGLATRLLHHNNSRPQAFLSYKDHSKKYKKCGGCDLTEDNSNPLSFFNV